MPPKKSKSRTKAPQKTQAKAPQSQAKATQAKRTLRSGTTNTNEDASQAPITPSSPPLPSAEPSSMTAQTSSLSAIYHNDINHGSSHYLFNSAASARMDNRFDQIEKAVEMIQYQKIQPFKNPSFSAFLTVTHRHRLQQSLI